MWWSSRCTDADFPKALSMEKNAETYRIKVSADEKKEGVTVLADGRLHVRVRAKREEGRANERCLTLLADYFGVTSESLTIVKGYTQSTKTVILRSK